MQEAWTFVNSFRLNVFKSLHKCYMKFIQQKQKMKEKERKNEIIFYVWEMARENIFCALQLVTKAKINKRQTNVTEMLKLLVLMYGNANAATDSGAVFFFFFVYI